VTQADGELAALPAGGDRVVVQHYRRASDAARRIQLLAALAGPAEDAGVLIPSVRASDLAARPPWIAFDALPGRPVSAVADGVERFAEPMGAMLAAFRALPRRGLELDDVWARPAALVAQAARWAKSAVPDLPVDALLRAVPVLFDGRPAVLAHGEFTPANVLTDGTALTGLLDVTEPRLADPLFDVAWWHWTVGLAPAPMLERAWPRFLRGAGVSADEPLLLPRIRALQALRMLQLLADAERLEPDVRAVVLGRLRAAWPVI
jgi:aminoglycoside phosphotransferase (APT) family kinase protein